MKYIVYLIVPLLLLSLYGSCGNDSGTIITNRCFSVASTNPCFDSNTGGSKIVIDDRSANEVINEKLKEPGFIEEIETAHVIKSFNQSINDFECNEFLSESEFVIKRARDWDRFRNSCFFSQFKFSRNIDFSNETILVSIQDTRSGGSGTEIISILDFTSEIVAVIKDDETSAPDNFLQFIFHIISIPKIDDRPVDFIRVKESEVNICFSQVSDEPCFNTNGVRTFITDKLVDQVINENISREDFVNNITITFNRESGPFFGPPESFLNPECVAAWSDSEGLIDNKEDWDNFKLNCTTINGFRLRSLPDIDFSKEMILFSLQDKDGLGTTIDSILEFDSEVEVIIRDDLSDSELPIVVFPSDLVVVPRTDLPVNFTRVNNQSGINTIEECTAEKAFAVVPACLSDDIVSGVFSDCGCTGSTSGSFLLEFAIVVNGAPTPLLLFGEGISTSFAIESLDCDTISLSNHSPPLGTLENLNVPGLGLLNFTKILDQDTENVECDCIDSPCAAQLLTNNYIQLLRTMHT